MADKGKPRVFLCHAHEDKPRVRELLYAQLRAAGYQPWLDEEDLLPGVDWEFEIRRAIHGSDFFLACLSGKSIDKRGYVQKELKMGLDVLDQMPEGSIYLVPVRLEACPVPERLQTRQWVDLFQPGGFERLKRALDFQLGKRQPVRQPFEPELILIPAGDFLMGSDPSQDEDLRDVEQPQHRLYLPDYYIAKTPVTNAQYLPFVLTGHPAPRHWENGKPPAGREQHPVVNVSWLDALAYCDWLAQATDKAYGLPSEAEWEKAARGTDGRIYPWGDKWDPKRCNTFEGERRDTSPVGEYSPQGDSPYGCVDVAGNVHEWTRSIESLYPYQPGDDREDLTSEDARVLRGGAWIDPQRMARCAYRSGSDPRFFGVSLGFRVVVSLALPPLVTKLAYQRGKLPMFSILVATYGAGYIRRDVTEFLNGQIVNNSLHCFAKNTFFGFDPVPGTKKDLRVMYQFQGKVFDQTFQEDQEVKLP